MTAFTAAAAAVTPAVPFTQKTQGDYPCQVAAGWRRCNLPAESEGPRPRYFRSMTNILSFVFQSELRVSSFLLLLFSPPTLLLLRKRVSSPQCSVFARGSTCGRAVSVCVCVRACVCVNRFRPCDAQLEKTYFSYRHLSGGSARASAGCRHPDRYRARHSSRPGVTGGEMHTHTQRLARVLK